MKNLFPTRLTIIAAALVSSLQIVAADGLGNHYANRVAPDSGASWVRQNPWDISIPTFSPTANYVINDSRLKFTSISGGKIPYGEARYVGCIPQKAPMRTYNTSDAGEVYVYGTTLWKFTNPDRFGTLTVWNTDLKRAGGWFWQKMTLKGFVVCYTSRGMVVLPWNGGYNDADLPMPQSSCPATKVNSEKR